MKIASFFAINKKNKPNMYYNRKARKVMQNRLIIIDGNSVLNRAYFGVTFLSTKNGQPIHAVYGFLNIFLKILNTMEPTHVVVAFDVKAPTFRKQIYDDYKAGRRPPDPNMLSQFPILKEILDAMGVYRIEKEGWEADDLIGTITKQFNGESYIITSDGDALQLISDNVKVLRTLKGFTDVEEFDLTHLQEVEGLRPEQIIDLKALMGDSSDNIPGARGIGPKKAKELLEKFDNINNLYNSIEEVAGKTKDILIQYKDDVFMSYKLATIDRSTPIESHDDDYFFELKVSQNLLNVLYKYELKTFIAKLMEKTEVSMPTMDEFADINQVIIDNMEQLDKVIKMANSSTLSFYLENDDVQFAFDQKTNYKLKIKENFFEEGLDFYDAIQLFKPYFTTNDTKLILFAAKDLMYVLRKLDIDFSNTNIEDIQLMFYLLDSNRKNDSIDKVLQSDTKFYATAIYKKCEELITRIEEKGLYKLYKEVEKPLIFVLFDMEITGFKINVDVLDSLDEYFDKEIKILSDKIYDLAGEKFNINSPKQLGQILFDKLNLKPGKTTQSGYSTNADVLECLIDSHEIIGYILNYRDSKKIQSTYITPIREMLDSSQRIHTIFKQTLTATGRLSSVEPNLQNIPIRKKEGREIRKMFVASDGHKLLSADYSQIELRLLAHLSNDEKLIEAYNEGKDIHSITAAKIFNIPLDNVTPDMRRQAKAVNFGIIYGISSFGLANDIGINLKQAKMFIETYFRVYPVVKEYIDGNVEFARKYGYITSMSGRIRYIPEIYSARRQEKQFGERIAMNMPLQGSASDVIKMAMVDVYNKLKDKFKAKIILQIHDELIIDCPISEIEKVSKILNDSMENIVKLRVPLIAEVKVGDSWYETK